MVEVVSGDVSKASPASTEGTLENGSATPVASAKPRKLTKNQMKREKKKQKKQAALETGTVTDSEAESVSSVPLIKPTCNEKLHADCFSLYGGNEIRTLIFDTIIRLCLPKTLQVLVRNNKFNYRLCLIPLLTSILAI